MVQIDGYDRRRTIDLLEDTIKKLLGETNQEVRNFNNEIDIRRTLFSKWKIHAASRKETTGTVKEHEKVTVDVDPEIIHRVERALQLVSRCKPLPETNPQTKIETSRPGGTPRPTASSGIERTRRSTVTTRPGGAPHPNSILSSSKTSTSSMKTRTSESSREQRPGISRGGGIGTSRRGLPPVISQRPSSSRSRPAHQTAPFKTDHNISSAHYRRARPAPTRPPAPPRPSQFEASARLHSGLTVTCKMTRPAAVAKKWLDDDKPLRRQIEDEEGQEPSTLVSQRLEEVPPYTAQGDIAERSVFDTAMHGEEVRRGELRRSLSMESMHSPRETDEQGEETGKFIFSKFIKCVPIPMKLKRELRQSRRLLRQLISAMHQGESVSARRFLDRLEDSNSISDRAKIFHCLEMAKEVEKRFWIFDQVRSRIELSRMTAEQARWCWQWLYESLEKYVEFQALLRGIRDQVWRDYDDEVEKFLIVEKGRAVMAELTSEDVYNIVGVQRVSVHYSQKMDLFRYMDKLSHLHKLQQTLRVMEGLKVELGDLKTIVKNAENPATAYRQLSGLLINRFPVMIFDDG